jgi:dienelactone hydrolase
MAPALTTRRIRLVGRWPRPLPISLRSFLNTVTPSFICAVGARVFPPTKAHFTQDLLKQAEAKGADARKQLHYQLITGSQLDDALAGLTFLKAAPDVDPKRIAIVGHSFGAMLTLLSGDHDRTIRAEVAFAAGANSWRASQELRDRTLAAVGKTVAPIMLVYAANDFDTSPGKDISAELDRLHKSHLFKIYPVIGKTSADGHSLLYLGISEWELDAFQFLDDNVKP